MIIAWMMLASTGIFVARYFKFMLADVTFCKIKFWFLLHRPLMICVTLISIASFIIILWGVEWKWVDPDESVIFAHSIFGTVTIGLAIIQVIISGLIFIE
jgi:hypothetical protein